MAETDTSFERLLALFRYRGLEGGPNIAAGTETVQALLAAGQKVTRALEQLARRQAETIQSSTRALMGNAPNLASPGDFKEASQANLTTLAQAAETTMRHLGEMAELLVKYNAEVIAAMNRSVMGGLTGGLGAMAAPAPAGEPSIVVTPPGHVEPDRPAPHSRAKPKGAARPRAAPKPAPKAATQKPAAKKAARKKAARPRRKS